ncbi:MAG: DUF4139 domain-containing protein [Terriglobia bacterium]
MKRAAVILPGILLLLWGTAFSAGPKLTIYNQDFAVVRIEVPLDLKAGMNHVELNDITDTLEPDSVILRDPSGEFPLRIVEQNYRADPASQQRLLQLYEGKEIDFLVRENGHSEIVHGKIIRSGFMAPNRRTYYPQPYGTQPPFSPEPRQPIVEVNGQLRFTLPGEPLFPVLTQGSILKPVLSWAIESQKAGHVDAELSYITEGLDWDATYNVIEPPTGRALDLLGWVTLHNRSGKSFEDAQIKLMAGTVNKLQPQAGGVIGGIAGGVPGGFMADRFQQPLVTQKPFDEYHLYELHRPVTLRDQETKQVEFIRAGGIQSDRYYVYDGLELPQNQYNGWSMEAIRQNREFGTESTQSVRVMRDFANTPANHLGVPLPGGRLRFYRQDQDGNLEFLGESQVPRTPENETVSVYTGNAFDLVGDRTRTNYVINMMGHTLDESFEIELRNHQQTPVEVRVVEHLYRGSTWEIIQHSNAFVKMDSHTIEFRVEVPPSGEKQITYTAHYTW